LILGEKMDFSNPAFVYTTSSLGLVLLILVLIHFRIRPARFNLSEKHVVITGGSSGIGKAVAKKIAQAGSHVTIIARDQKKLEAAVLEIRESIPPCEGEECQLQFINWVSADLAKGHKEVENAIKEAERKCGGRSADVLVASAGHAVPKAFRDLAPAEVEGMCRLNYLSAVDACRAVLPGMVARGGGRIALVASQAAQAPIFGYTGYAPTKCALKGFAEALQMEVHRDGVHLSVAFPPDTDTPGFAEENKTKAPETHLVAESGALFGADQVAESIVNGIVKGRFLVWTGFDGWLLCNLTANMGPVFSVSDAFFQVMLSSLLRLVGFFYIVPWYITCKKAKAGLKKKS